MKKIIAFVTVAFAVSASQGIAAEKKHAASHKAPVAAAPHAAATHNKSYSRPYGIAGCGWGHMVVGKNGNQIFAATTNGTSGNQTFGITSGTADCDDSATSHVASRMDVFVAANKVALSGDIARGGGETLNNLSAMMGCSIQADQFGTTMQNNFRSIFPSHDVPANEVTDAIINSVKQNDVLSANCKSIG